MIGLVQAAAQVSGPILLSTARPFSFWKALATQAAARDLTRAALIGQIDHARPPQIGLATALRLYVLSTLQAQDP